MPSRPNLSQNPDFRQRRAEAGELLRNNLNIRGILEATRERFHRISTLLKKENINKHDQGHQWRTALNAALIMMQLEFSKKEILLASGAALIHDIGYLAKSEVKPDDKDGKAQFKEHALKGATEAKDRIGRMLNVMNKLRERKGENDEADEPEKEKNVMERVLEECEAILRYRDENGEWKAPNDEGVLLMEESILNHNDYGKNDIAYDPEKIKPPALAVQIGDKLDICKERVYAEHMSPKAFIKGINGFDSHYFHRCVPFCVQNYELSINQEEKTMKVIYHVDPSDFIDIMRREFPHFEYSNEHFSSDFMRAYTRSCEVAAEAAGVLLGNITDDTTLEVELHFKDGENRTLPFSRPLRPKSENKAA